MTERIPLRRRLLYLHSACRDWINGVRYDLGLWRELPLPHAVKRRTVRAFADRYGLRTFVETGTYMGDMIAGMASRFDRIYTIELQPMFHQKAVARFADKAYIAVLHGDSGEEIAKVVRALAAPALFWLDAHYSGGFTARGTIDTPVLAELQHILRDSSVRHVVLVDDARLFEGRDGYPTIDELRALVAQWRPEYGFAVEKDIIRIAP